MTPVRFAVALIAVVLLVAAYDLVVLRLLDLLFASDAGPSILRTNLGIKIVSAIFMYIAPAILTVASLIYFHPQRIGLSGVQMGAIGLCALVSTQIFPFLILLLRCSLFSECL